jgi:hypothetical protein
VFAGPHDLNALFTSVFLAQVAAARGDAETLERYRSFAAEPRDSTHVDQRVAARLILARDAIEHGGFDEALDLAQSVLDETLTGHEFRAEAYALSIEAALATGNDGAMTRLEQFVAELPPTRSTPQMRAGRARIMAEQAHRRGDERAADGFEREAIALLRSIGARPLLARTLVERAGRRDDDAALVEARAIYSELGAHSWLARIDETSGLAA